MTSLPANSSLFTLATAFSRARDPELADLLGTHDGSFAGPWWLRWAAPITVNLTGMAGWCGKALRPSGADTLVGENRSRGADGTVSASIPITARLGIARLDQRPAIIVDYPHTAPWPWRHVTDELRPLDGHTLLGLTYGIPATPPAGVPFLLHRATR
jgi:hypothetical protein